MNKELYESLSPEDRKIVDEEALSMENRRFVSCPEQQAMYEKKLEEYGIKLLRPTPEVIQNFSDVAHEKVWPELRKILGERSSTSSWDSSNKGEQSGALFRNARKGGECLLIPLLGSRRACDGQKETIPCESSCFRPVERLRP